MISLSVPDSEEELKRFLIRRKEESDKAGLKLSIQKTKIMASGPIVSWQLGGEKMKAVTDFLFLCSKITADGDRSLKIKRCLLLGRKAMTHLDRILKSKDNPMDLPPGSSVLEILQARILEWVAMPASRGSQPRDGN